MSHEVKPPKPSAPPGEAPPADGPEAIQRELLQRALEGLAGGDMLSFMQLLPMERWHDGEWSVARIPLLPIFLNPMGILHGGVTAIFLDSLMGWSLAEQAGRPVVTVQLNVNYVKPGRGPWVVVRARPTHIGRFTGVVEGRVEDHEGQLISQGTGTFFFTGDGDGTG